MSLLATAPPDALARLWRDFGACPDFTWLRAPETGSTMIQGRMGATGAPFNLGEMTVTRCTLRLATPDHPGTLGYACIAGRNKARAEAAALIDALMQTGRAGELQARVLAPLAQIVATAKAARAAKSAATRVEFFTLVRGEDA